MKTCFRLTAAVLLIASIPTAYGETTRVSIHVLSQDAKFIGSSVGGARITLTATETGELLAEGVTQGETGDTDLIMRTPRRRDSVLVTEDTAGFVADVDLDQPTRVTATAYGPLDYADSANVVSASRWLIPGQDLSIGNGWLLVMPGLVVDLHELPQSVVRLDNDSAVVAIRARVTMMCGCPIEPDGLWDAAEFEVEAALLRDGAVERRQPLRYAGESSEFSAELPITASGDYEVVVTATQPRTGNSGTALGALRAR